MDKGHPHIISKSSVANVSKECQSSNRETAKETTEQVRLL